MILTWWKDGAYPGLTSYGEGMRLVWFSDTSTNPWGLNVFGNWDWHEAADPQYWYYYVDGTGQHPTTTGLSGQVISEIIIYSNQPPAPVAAFTSDVQTGTAPLSVNFTDGSTGTPPLAYAWDFDNNGKTDAIAQNPTYVYSTPGTYSVKLTVTNAWGSDDEVKTNYISVTAPPVPFWDLNGDHVCNIGDVVIIGLVWGQTGTPGWRPEDLSPDGVINIGDVVVLGLHWGQTW